jgi:hypothetical protein
LPDELIVDLPHGNWQVTGVLPGTSVDLKMTGNQLRIQPAREFEGYVIHLENDGQIEYTLGRQQELE